MSQSTRRSIIAGQWYPGTAHGLERTIGRFFDKAESPDLDGQVIGLISPHAGYQYSGQAAAYAYSQVRDQSFDVVAIISPVHQIPLGRFAITSASAYETPLGLVELDLDLVRELEERVPINRVGYDGEHSLEIQLPFLQVALERFTVLPVMIGDASFGAGEELGHALSEVLADRRALIVASSDMHHIRDYQQVVRRDKAVMDALASFDMPRIREALSPRDCSVCGRIPIVAMLTAAKTLGADQVQVLYHTNSGDVTGDHTPGQYTVGYLAAAVYRRR
ncbi:MAG: AmmeMemoRadiSam system protein B [Anaerolineae bacterium]|nr:AmmeMemoRadiSam system protein B [Anaerolineae bacterium]